MTLGKKLQLLRKARGMSQEQLADALGVSRQAVSKWELDATLPDTANVVALGKLFGVTTDYLLVEDETGADGKKTELSSPESGSDGPVKINWYKCRFYGGLILLALGALGLFAVFAVSRFTPVPVPIITEQGGERWYTYDSSHTDIDFGYFVEKYKLESLLAMLGVMAAVGVALLLWDRYVGPWFRRFMENHKNSI